MTAPNWSISWTAQVIPLALVEDWLNWQYHSSLRVSFFCHVLILQASYPFILRMFILMYFIYSIYVLENYYTFIIIIFITFFINKAYTHI